MQFSLNTLAFALFTSASALKITSPVKGDIVSTTGSFEVTWESVVTDVGNFSISARKSGDSSPSAETQVTGLLATSNKYAYVRGAAFPSEGKYVLWARSTVGEKGILAESEEFTVSATNATVRDLKNSTDTDDVAPGTGSGSGSGSDSSSAKKGQDNAAGSVTLDFTGKSLAAGLLVLAGVMAL